MWRLPELTILLMMGIHIVSGVLFLFLFSLCEYLYLSYAGTFISLTNLQKKNLKAILKDCLKAFH